MSNQAHIQGDIAVGKKSLGYWSISPSGHVCVFFHGFGGSATDTWMEFPALMAKEPRCAGKDLIFYGYDGLYTRADISAVLVYQFLDALLTRPTSIINPSIHSSQHRSDSFSYSAAMIVAHSLGAVVARRAVLNARHEKKEWVSKVGFVLFAPAHMGANVVQLGLQAVTGIPWFGEAAGSAVTYKFKVLQDLETESVTLKQLFDDTRKALDKGDASYLIARKVIFGEKDGIVNPNRFCDDPVMKVFLDKNHIDVCKPNAAFEDPVAEILEVL